MISRKGSSGLGPTSNGIGWATPRAARSRSSRPDRWRCGRPAQPPRSRRLPAGPSLETRSCFTFYLHLASHSETEQPLPAPTWFTFLAIRPAPTRRAGRLGLDSSRLPSPTLLARVLLQPALVLGMPFLEPAPRLVLGLPAGVEDLLA